MAKRFKYTSGLKPDTPGGTASVLMAVISAVLFLVAGIISYVFSGKGGSYLGAIGLTAMLLAVCGFFIGLHSFSDKDKNHRYSTIGSLTNGVIAVIWLTVYLLGVG